MKKPLLLSVSLLMSSLLFSQTTATDFTVNDCDGDSHTLFTELDSGKVVVICWVMPCGGCVSAALTAYNVAQSYESTDPGKVLYYLVDDYANTSCSSVSSWGTSNVGENITAAFSDSDIDMNDYGSTGMPKVVVVGGPSHTIYYNKNSSVSSTDMQTAIESGLAETSGIKSNANNPNSLSIFPNPSSKNIYFNYSLDKSKNIKIDIYNMLGENIYSYNLGIQNAGKHQFEINTADLNDGFYFLTIDGKTVKFQVSN
jgi:hypothetical protein